MQASRDYLDTFVSGLFLVVRGRDLFCFVFFFLQKKINVYAIQRKISSHEIKVNLVNGNKCRVFTEVILNKEFASNVHLKVLFISFFIACMSKSLNMRHQFWKAWIMLHMKLLDDKKFWKLEEDYSSLLLNSMKK